MSPALIEALFGPAGVPPSGADAAAALDAAPPNAFAQRIADIIRTMRINSSASQRVRVVREGSGDAAEERFKWHLIWDEQAFPGGNVSYESYDACCVKDSLAPAAGVAMGGMQSPQ